MYLFMIIVLRAIAFCCLFIGMTWFRKVHVEQVHSVLRCVPRVLRQCHKGVRFVNVQICSK